MLLKAAPERGGGDREAYDREAYRCLASRAAGAVASHLPSQKGGPKSRSMSWSQ